MTHVTTAMMAAHTGRCVPTITRALKKHKVPNDNEGTSKRIRVKFADANRFVQKMWPERGPLDPAKLIVTESK